MIFAHTLYTIWYELQVEKSELRDEKMRLKAEKDRLEQMLKGVSAAPQFIPYPTAPVVAYNKAVPYPNYPPAGVWQWVPPAVLDTSKDSVLWPPVA